MREYEIDRNERLKDWEYEWYELWEGKGGVYIGKIGRKKLNTIFLERPTATGLAFD